MLNYKFAVEVKPRLYVLMGIHASSLILLCYKFKVYGNYFQQWVMLDCSLIKYCLKPDLSVKKKTKKQKMCFFLFILLETKFANLKWFTWRKKYLKI